MSNEFIAGLKEALRLISDGCMGSTMYYPDDWERGLDDGIEKCQETIARHISYLERKAAADAAGESRYRVTSFVRPWPDNPDGVYVLQYVMNDELLFTDVCATTLELGSARIRRDQKLKNVDLFEDVSGKIIALR